MISTLKVVVMFFLVCLLATSTVMAQASYDNFSSRIGYADGKPVMPPQQQTLIREPIMAIRCSSGQIGSSSVPCFLDVIKEYAAAVSAVWRIRRTNPSSQTETVEGPFFVAKDFALTRNGPGYFYGLGFGARLPIGEINLGNTGDKTILEVSVMDSTNGGQLVQSGRTTLWSQSRAENLRVDITSAEIILGNNTIKLTGTFPKDKMAFGVGNPGWDSGFTEIQAFDGKTVFVPIPTNSFGNQLHPIGWDAQGSWGITLVTADHESFYFPGIIKVKGRIGIPTAFPGN